ncbi:hypothetical protein BDR22DRAFT_844982 [Usnea florida]
MRFHLNPRLAEPIPSSHDVFLVVRPRKTVEPPIGSLKHWSFYCQGHFYHLSARGLRRDCFRESQNTSKSQGVSCQLTHEDWNNLDQGTFESISEAERRRPLVAYKVGQTDYRPDQILRLASWVIEQLPSYNLFDANCQHFVKSMVGRTVMRLCDRTVFMGSKSQIVEWSLRKGDQCHVNNADSGWIIAPPLPIHKNSFWSLNGDRVKMFWNLHEHVDERMIRTLYEKGPHAFGAQTHRDEWEQLKRDFKGDIDDARIRLLIRYAETKKDFSQKRWKDVFLGRRKKQFDGTIRRPRLLCEPGRRERRMMGMPSDSA